MRQCGHCKEIKPDSEFYKNKNVRKIRNLSTLCKDCERLNNRRKRQEYNKTYKEKDRRYYLKNKDRIIEKRLAWYNANKDKALAHEAVKRALYNGSLIRPMNCEECGRVVKLVAHHEDYNKPLEVKWICAECHMRKHHGSGGGIE